MFGLAPFSGAPFSSVLSIAGSSTLTGLSATALLNSVLAENVVNVNLTGNQTVASLMAGSAVMNPAYWTLVDTSQT